MQILRQKKSIFKEGNRTCFPCGVTSNNIHHWESTGHKRNVILSKFQANLCESKYDDTKLDIVIANEDKNIDFIKGKKEINIVTEPGVEKGFMLRVGHKLEEKISKQVWLEAMIPDGIDTVYINSITKIIDSNNPVREIKVSCFSIDVGEYLVPIILKYSDDQNLRGSFLENQVVIHVRVKIYTKELEDLLPQTKFSERICREKDISRQGIWLPPEEKEARTKNLEQEKKIRFYPIDESLRNLNKEQLSTKSMENTLPKEKMTLMKNEIDSQNYVDKFQFLLQCEQVYCEKELENLDIDKVSVNQVGSGQLIVEASVDLGHSSQICQGDMVYLCISGTDSYYRSWIDKVINFVQNNTIHVDI